MNRPNEDAYLFDFITSTEFKSHLVSDYNELRAAIEHGLWKSAHVLAGSIIEAILVDYLIAVRHNGQTEEQLLRWHLAEMFPAGKAEGILTDRTVQLCTVVKNFRNLIHPGRLVREDETVNGDGAQVALSLVRMVAGDIARKKAEKYGYTAEQLVRKLLDDPDCLPIVPHFLREMHETEKARLVLEVLPARNWAAQSSVLQGSIAQKEVATNLGECYQLVLSQATYETKTSAVKQYVSILKEQSRAYRLCYEETFVTFQNFDSVADYFEIGIIKAHILSRLKETSSEVLLRMARGIGKAITLQDIESGETNALYNHVLQADTHEGLQACTWFWNEQDLMAADVSAKMIEQLHQSKEYFEGVNNTHACMMLDWLITRMPF